MKKILGTVAATTVAAGAFLAGGAAPALAAEPGCRVSYIPVTQSAGYVATVLVTNTSSTPVTGWTLGFELPAGQQVASSWSTRLTVTGSSVTARNAIWNGYLAANGGTGTFGFEGAYTGTYSSPSSFTLNGQACTKS
ncbi:hypothetical protein GCM10010435_24140 [Winogradskya consettensis]|uniref:CBM2 domain-containing protein n=1 Tax=Winogradskya consettensis TaxID=113560 RepID=A0A919T0H5_9ACTN|nr:cellulose binding domain-containing protein [Actinoplanes consettensis]GIM82434.1 hypothetical protein Aco04nite_81460 [Actinoplanes consettensis]